MADYNSSLPVRSEADIDERLQSKIVDFTDPTKGMEVDADNDAHVKAKLRDDAGSAFGIESNPVFVTVTDNPNAEVHEHDIASAIAKDAIGSHSYSPTGNVKINRLMLSASGKARFEIKFGPTASEVSKYVFFNSTANPNVMIDLKAPITLAATDTLIIEKKNLDNQAQDLYSTINGDEIA